MCVALFLAFLCCAYAPAEAEAPALSARPEEWNVLVTLRPSKTRYSVGEPIYLRIDIWNRGESPIEIPWQITLLRGGGAHIELVLKDTEGKISPSRIGRMHSAGNRGQPQSDAITGRRILLAPGYSYGRWVTIDSGTYPFLASPGRYQILATYHCAEQRGEAPRVFGGEVRVDPLWIEVVPWLED